MLLKSTPAGDGGDIFDQFDSPFVHEAFVQAGDGRITAGPVACIAGHGYCLPFETERSLFSLGCRVCRYWAHGYGPLGGAFFDEAGVAHRSEDGFHAALDKMVKTAGADVVLWPYFPLEAREFAWLHQWAELRVGPWAGRSVLAMRAHCRAFLDCRSEGASASAGLSLSRNKRKTLGRQERRLKELGKLELVSTTRMLDHDRAIEAFLKVEASGWKAQKGTALAVDSQLLAFVGEFLPQMLDEGRARIDLLMLDELPIAGLVSFRAGRGLFTWKTGMDEDYQRFSPGVHVLLAVSREAIANPDIDYVDSLADEGHPVAEHLWAGRRRYAHLLVPLTVKGYVASHTLRAGYTGKDRLCYWVKRALGRV